MVDTPELPESLQIELKKPITFNGKTVDVIHLEEPTLGQIEQARKKTAAITGDSSLAFIREIVVLVGLVDSHIVSQMRISDVMKAAEYIMGFMQDKPKDKPTETL